VSGTVRNAAGATRAVVWIDRGNGWATFPIDTPGNANSQANSVAIFESGWSTCGAVMQSARTRGFCADSADNLNLLTPLDGYDNSSALRHNQPFDDGAGPFNNIVTGISWNAGGTPVATVWINGQPSPAQQLLLDPNAVADVTAFKPTGNPAVNIGQIVDSTGNGQPRGAVFLNSNIVVPDSLSIVAGRYGEGKLAGLWHNDGDEFSIRTLSVDGVRTATVDLKLLTATQTGPTTWIYTLTIVARVESNGAGVTGTLNIFQRNESDLYVLLQSRALTDNEQLITFTFPNGLWRNPTTGLLETRLEFIQNGNRPAAVLIESMQMTYE
jgi:hypothetical protein